MRLANWRASGKLGKCVETVANCADLSNVHYNARRSVKMRLCSTPFCQYLVNANPDTALNLLTLMVTVSGKPNPINLLTLILSTTVNLTT